VSKNKEFSNAYGYRDSSDQLVRIADLILTVSEKISSGWCLTQGNIATSYFVLFPTMTDSHLS